MATFLRGKILRAAENGSFLHSRASERSILAYVRNRHHRYRRSDIDDYLRALFHRGPWTIEVEWGQKSVKWMRSLVTRKDGTYRDTYQTRRLSQEQLHVAANVTTFELVGVHVEVSPRGEFFYPNHAAAREAFCIYRAISPSGYFDFFYRSWQSSHWRDPTSAGVHAVSAVKHLR